MPWLRDVVRISDSVGSVGFLKFFHHAIWVVADKQQKPRYTRLRIGAHRATAAFFTPVKSLLMPFGAFCSRVGLTSRHP